MSIAHRGDRVDQRNHVAARRFDRPRKFGDVGHIRAEFGDQRERGRAAHRRNHLRRQHRIGAECDASRFHIGTGDVDFQRGDPVALRVEPGGDFAVFGDGRAPDVHDGRGADLAQERHIAVAVQELFHARPLQADRIEHPAGDFGDAGRRVAVRRLHADSLDHHRAEAGDVVVVVIFKAVAEGAGSGHHRIFQRDAAEFRCQVSHCRYST